MFVFSFSFRWQFLFSKNFNKINTFLFIFNNRQVFKVLQFHKILITDYYKSLKTQYYTESKFLVKNRIKWGADELFNKITFK